MSESCHVSLLWAIWPRFLFHRAWGRAETVFIEALTIHATSYVHVKGNVAFDIIGHMPLGSTSTRRPLRDLNPEP